MNGTNCEFPHRGAFCIPHSHSSWGQIFASWIKVLRNKHKMWIRSIFAWRWRVWTHIGSITILTALVLLWCCSAMRGTAWSEVTVMLIRCTVPHDSSVFLRISNLFGISLPAAGLYCALWRLEGSSPRNLKRTITFVVLLGLRAQWKIIKEFEDRKEFGIPNQYY